MDKSTKIFGIDISKDVFDVIDPKDRHFQYVNMQKGFGSFQKF